MGWRGFSCATRVRTPGGVRHKKGGVGHKRRIRPQKEAKRRRTPQRERRLLQSVRRGGGGAVAALVGCTSRWIRSFDVTVGCVAGGWLGVGARFCVPRRSRLGSR